MVAGLPSEVFWSSSPYKPQISPRLGHLMSYWQMNWRLRPSADLMGTGRTGHLGMLYQLPTGTQNSRRSTLPPCQRIAKNYWARSGHRVGMLMWTSTARNHQKNQSRPRAQMGTDMEAQTEIWPVTVVVSQWSVILPLWARLPDRMCPSQLHLFGTWSSEDHNTQKYESCIESVMFLDYIACYVWQDVSVMLHRTLVQVFRLVALFLRSLANLPWFRCC